MPQQRRLLSARRKARGFTQESLGARLRVASVTVRRWESGTASPQPDKRHPLATALGVSMDELDVLLETNPQANSSVAPEVTSASASREGAPVNRRDFLAAGVGFSSSFVGLAHDDSAQSNDRSNVIEIVRDLTVTYSAHEQRHGGGNQARVAVEHYLQTQVAPQLASASSSARQDMFRAVAELLYVIGWMSYDASEHAVADRYLTSAARMAHEAGDGPLEAHILRAMAHQAIDLGDRTRALGLARRSMTPGRYGRACPRERALIQVIYARALIANDEHTAAARTLLHAESDLRNASPSQEEPQRVFFFGEASLSHETACGLRDMGDFTGAAKHFAHSVRTRNAERFTRTHALTLGLQADVEFRRGNVEEAFSMWNTSLDSMHGIRSGRTRNVASNILTTLNSQPTIKYPGSSELAERADLYLSLPH
ncbi:helix-turn-helix domain-containing protein [Natronoglycomyces albus]|uniref:Helix-turn-helix transcriptional regulator n=1 Tax=Natronoglycomyces albus TaxID=2811108 RepID=A0A895XK81_9ACTN|nr:helix-turn-helix transcriptional regulator [Natronoglycomyces albus]QSB03963.1 helix-turn-helix transcriptional regulator [Natronoglycomyces albus]